MTPTPIPIHCAHDALVDVTQVVPNPRNPNRHPEKQVALLAKIIRQAGWRAPIVVSRRSGFVVTGHGRLQAAVLLGIETVPVNYQDFESEAAEWAHMVADNHLAELSSNEEGALRDLLRDLKDGGAIELTGFTSAEADALLEEFLRPAASEPEEVSTPRFTILVTCPSEANRTLVMGRLKSKGVDCRLHP